MLGTRHAARKCYKTPSGKPAACPKKTSDSCGAKLSHHESRSCQLGARNVSCSQHRLLNHRVERIVVYVVEPHHAGPIALLLLLLYGGLQRFLVKAARLCTRETCGPGSELGPRGEDTLQRPAHSRVVEEVSHVLRDPRARGALDEVWQVDAAADALLGAEAVADKLRQLRLRREVHALDAGEGLIDIGQDALVRHLALLVRDATARVRGGDGVADEAAELLVGAQALHDGALVEP
mmetsp:Transcript_15118/g.43684  ORF Transcript_15118/g.43684 Transcript_15118/m.43684 type:complete len:236 (+) Transcript_15118:184-891(+)